MRCRSASVFDLRLTPMPEHEIMGLPAFARTFAGYLRPHRNKVIGLLLLLSVDVAFKTVWPLSFKFLIDHALGEANRTLLITTIIALFGGVLVAMGCAVVRDYLYAHVGARVLH